MGSNNTREKVLKKIREHQPRGNLSYAATLLLPYLSNLPRTRSHSERVAWYSREVAIRLKKDSNAAFYAGLFHDIGKTRLAKELFDGHDINDKEYKEIQKHAVLGFLILKDAHLFTALCVGMHHAVYKNGYGITKKNLPHNFGERTVKKILNIAAIVSVCDYIDSFRRRKTKLKNVPNRELKLPAILMKKYHRFPAVVEAALEVMK